MLPEEMMEPKNECQPWRDREQRMVGGRERDRLFDRERVEGGSDERWRVNGWNRNGENNEGRLEEGRSERREETEIEKERVRTGGVMNDTSLGSHSSICPSSLPLYFYHSLYPVLSFFLFPFSVLSSSLVSLPLLFTHTFHTPFFSFEPLSLHFSVLLSFLICLTYSHSCLPLPSASVLMLQLPLVLSFLVAPPHPSILFSS